VKQELVRRCGQDSELTCGAKQVSSSYLGPAGLTLGQRQGR